LHFAENNFISAGQNPFDVILNGTTVLSGFDIFTAAGAMSKAVVESFTATADATGQITAAFHAGSGQYGQVNGIEVLSGTTRVLAINCGVVVNGTIRIDPSTFTNQGTLQASNGGTLDVGHFQPNVGTVEIGAGSIFRVEGDFTQASVGSLLVQVGGTAANASGQMQVTGAVTLAGALQVTLVNGFTPAAGDQFTLITDASQSGTFDTQDLPVLGGGLAFHVTYDATDVLLGVS
jgi:hypothetical protein